MASAGKPMADVTFTAYEVPLSAVMKWPPGNFTNPVRRHWFVAYAVALHSFATLVVLARLWTRARKSAGGWGFDDLFVALGYAFASVVLGLGIFGVLRTGLDRHVWDVLPQTVGKAGFVGWLTEIIFLLSLCSTKISVLIFFRRLVDRTHSRVMIHLITAGILLIVAYLIAIVMFLTFACKPVEAAWKSLNITWAVPYKCVSRRGVDVANGTISIITDAYSILIPVSIVRKLSMPRAKKIILHTIFCCGLVVVGASIARTYYLVRMFTDPLRDLTWVGHDLLVWGFLEIDMATICASAPAMKGFFARFGEKLTTRRGVSSDHSRDKYGRRGYAHEGTGDPDSVFASDQYGLTRLEHDTATTWFDGREKPSPTSSGDTDGHADNSWRKEPVTQPDAARARYGAQWLFAAEARENSGQPRSRSTANRGGPPSLPRPLLGAAFMSERGRDREREESRLAGPNARGPTAGANYVQLNGGGIHVEQRWSVTSSEPLGAQHRAHPYTHAPPLPESREDAVDAATGRLEPGARFQRGAGGAR